MPTNDDFVFVAPADGPILSASGSGDVAAIADGNGPGQMIGFSHTVRERTLKGKIYAFRDLTLTDVNDIVAILSAEPVPFDPSKSLEDQM